MICVYVINSWISLVTFAISEIRSSKLAITALNYIRALIITWVILTCFK